VRTALGGPSVGRELGLVRSVEVTVGLVCVAASWALLLRCSGPADPRGPNEACFRALDCQGGLVCVEGRCTSDVTPIVPEGAAVAPTGADAGE
jgi:hypothetical protein